MALQQGQGTLYKYINEGRNLNSSINDGMRSTLLKRFVNGLSDKSFQMAFRSNSNWKLLKKKSYLSMSEINEIFDNITTIAGEDSDDGDNMTEQAPAPQTRDEMLTQVIETLAGKVAKIDIGSSRQYVMSRPSQS